MTTSEWEKIHTHILRLEQQGLVTRTFRRLDPERQQAVITAILEEANEHGPTSINIKRVAERAGVSTGSLYQYFNSREGLLKFAVEMVVRLVADAFNEYSSLLSSMPLRVRSYGSIFHLVPTGVETKTTARDRLASARVR